MRRIVTAAFILCTAAAAVFGQDSGASEKKTFDLTAKRFAFTPGIIEVTQGDTVVITATSADGTHGIAIKQFNVNTIVPKGGAPVTVEFVASEAGNFPITCSEYCGNGHKTMKARLVVAPRGTR